ncbi:MAG: toxin-antitoxin system protein [Bdellovibrionota bacterium]
MPQTTVRVTNATRAVLRSLAQAEGRSMQAILQSALEQYRRNRFLDEVNAGYAALRSDPKAWEDELTERKLWEQTLSDGLAEESAPYGRPKKKTRRGKRQ